MNTHFFNVKYEQPIVLALGFFDCIHNGHKALIDEMKRTAKRSSCESAVLTFANDPNPQLKKRQQIYTFLERSIVIENLEVENLIYAYFNEDFSHLTALEFLDKLTGNFNVKGVVVGRDYTFGKGAEGTVDFLKEYAADKDIKVKVVPYEKNYQKKLSTTTLKKYVTSGEISLLNSCLCQPYFMVGTIIHDKQRGTVLGYPTANISIHDDALRLAGGVYATKIFINDKMFFGVTNVGSKPTFGENSYTIETYILDFNKDIYGKEVRLEFHKKLRDVIKFNSIPSLVAQQNIDEKEAANFFGLNK